MKYDRRIDQAKQQFTLHNDFDKFRVSDKSAFSINFWMRLRVHPIFLELAAHWMEVVRWLENSFDIKANLGYGTDKSYERGMQIDWHSVRSHAM